MSPFGSNKLSGAAKNFSNGIAKGFESHGDKAAIDFSRFDNPYQFTPTDDSVRSRIRFYDRDSVWARWRRGYELFLTTQTLLGSGAGQRSQYGDYRMYCAYHLFPGIFVPLRIFAFPTSNSEIKKQIVGVRDANSFNFYNFGLSILGVRYLGDAKSATYSQAGTTITVNLPSHGYQLNDSIYLNFTSGTGVTTTLPIATKTNDTFTCTAAAPLTTSGNVSVALSTTFGDNRWTQHRVKLRSIFNPIPSLVGERMVDRVVERDPGIASTYSRTGTTVTATCSQAHGLATGNSIFASISTGSVTSKQYSITVLSSTQLQFTTSDSGTTSGNMTVFRLIPGYDYGNYAGYTLTGIDNANTELIFQRTGSYGAKTVNSKIQCTVPAERGFTVGRFLTTEMRYQCSCQDYTRRDGYNFFKEGTENRFPNTPITSTKPGNKINKDNSVSTVRDQPGSYGDLGYLTTTSGFYGLPDYQDQKSTSFPNVYYYQLRWCKHIYAALFSINADEGNTAILGKGTYTQSGPNITVTFQNHGLQQNAKVQIDFTSGAAISGEYSVSQVIDVNTFTVVYPFSGTAVGYCNISNIKRHQFIDAWLYEPTDKPVGDDLDTFYNNLTKENARVRKIAELTGMMSHGIEWAGATSITGDKNQPQQVADYSLKEISMYITDNLRRVGEDFNTSGELLNATQRMVAMMTQLTNISPSQILNGNFGMLDQPLYNYDATYRYGLVNGSQYLNGVPYSVAGSTTTASSSVTEDPSTVTTLDCLTYDPGVSQEFTVDAGLYINQ